ncbi:MAG: hypothetical protein HY360_14315 [Verrucomicrobia bacterium]|nr:hypothetical protein [Verrucomicrobiota bacterium]
MAVNQPLRPSPPSQAPRRSTRLVPSCYAPGNGTTFTAACLPRRHSGGPNILYLDGHVEWKLREKVSASEFNTTGKFQ